MADFLTTAEKLEQFRERDAKVNAMGGPKMLEKQKNLGKMTARERIDDFFDKGTFVEIDKFVTHHSTFFGMDKREVPADAVVCGYGKVDGRTVFIFSQDFTSMGGSMGEWQANKICKILEMAMAMGAPVVGFNDSGGARIQEGMFSLSGYGKIFFRNTRASGVVPQITCIMGPTAGGAVYSPAIMDYIFMVKGYGQMYITGPEVIKAATGEIITNEELGGAVTHTKISGNAHWACEDDTDCIARVKELLSYLPSSNREKPPVYPCEDPADRCEEKLNTFIPNSSNRVFNMRNLIKLVVDNGEILEVMKDYAANMLTLFARMNGQTIGIIANQPQMMSGCLDVNCSDKAARHIRFCDCFNIPIVTFVDVPGFLPGKGQEWGGIIRHGAKMLFAYSEATVPKITVIVRKAYGGSYMAMCSKDMGPDMVIAWPTAQIAVMGAEGAANIVWRKDIAAAEDPEAKRAELVQAYDELFNNPYIAASKGHIDCVLEPKLTRPTIISALDAFKDKVDKLPWKKHGNIPL